MQYPNFSFCYTPSEDSGSRARLGRLETPHGTIRTPAFIFCATKAAIKGVPVDRLQAHDTQIILSNTYHLMLQPGADTVEKLGGLHKMMGWNGPMLTDSGGFQIFSLGHGSVAAEIKGNRAFNSDRPKTLARITEEGALFRSYVDGSKHLLTPEKSIQVQRQLGADCILVLDECTPYHVDKAYTANSMALSHRWALRSLAEFQRYHDGKQALYGIIQGGVYPDLRRESAAFVNEQPFFGHAVGGSLGASSAQMAEVVGMTLPLLSRDRPVHLLGIGGIADIFMGVMMGIDTFDCVHPTRLARHGGALVQPHQLPAHLQDSSAGPRDHINLRNSAFKTDDTPIAEDCSCYTCQTASKGYLHHLLKAKELLACTLVSIHNIAFMNRLLSDIRVGIQQNNLARVKQRWISDFVSKSRINDFSFHL
jgi:queuine tRNA-ribosyltransferase